MSSNVADYTQSVQMTVVQTTAGLDPCYTMSPGYQDFGVINKQFELGDINAITISK